MNYIYKSLLKFCLWCEIPLKLLKVCIINVQDCGYIAMLFTNLRKDELTKNNITDVKI